MRSLRASLLAVLTLACSAPTDGRATEDGTVAHPRCESCHAADFEEADDPPHAGELPSTCFVCHTQDDWRPAHLDHDFFPLTGAHLEARCFNCHIILQGENEPHYEGIHTECVDCHRGDYDRSSFPGHQHFSLTCTECHSTSAWSPTLHPPPELDAGIDAGWGSLDGTTHASGPWHEGPIGIGHDAGVHDAGHHAVVHRDAGHRTTARRDAGARPPPPPPPTTTTEPDVHTRPSQRY